MRRTEVFKLLNYEITQLSNVLSPERQMGRDRVRGNSMDICEP